MNAEEVLSERSVQFSSQGADLVVKCLNPEHEDGSPSMRIDKITGAFHCFSCGFKGSIFKHFGLVNDLKDVRIQSIKKKISKLLAADISMPIGSVPFTEPFRDISVETLNRFEAFTHRDFEHRIVFPIRDILGEIIKFIGRHMHSNVNPKYILTPPKVSPPLFPSKPKMLQGSIILVEGIFDMLNLQDKGLSNAVCAFGTQTLLKSWEEKLDPFKLLGLNKVYILFDGDAAGQVAAKKLDKEINKEYLTEIINLPEGVDPGDLSEEDVLALKELVYEKNNS